VCHFFLYKFQINSEPKTLVYEKEKRKKVMHMILVVSYPISDFEPVSKTNGNVQGYSLNSV
jgi:hypothetical protein